MKLIRNKKRNIIFELFFTTPHISKKNSIIFHHLVKNSSQGHLESKPGVVELIASKMLTSHCGGQFVNTMSFFTRSFGVQTGVVELIVSKMLTSHCGGQFANTMSFLIKHSSTVEGEDRTRIDRANLR